MTTYPLSAKDVNDPDAALAVNDLHTRVTTLEDAGGGSGGVRIDRVFTGATDQGLAGIIIDAGTITEAWFCPARSAVTVDADTGTVVVGSASNGDIFGYTFDSAHPAVGGTPVQLVLIGAPDSPGMTPGDTVECTVSASGPTFDPASVLVDGVFTIVIGASGGGGGGVTQLVGDAAGSVVLGLTSADGTTVQRAVVAITSDTVPGPGAHATFRLYGDYEQAQLLASVTIDTLHFAGDVITLDLESVVLSTDQLLTMAYEDANGFLDNSTEIPFIVDLV